MTNYPFLGKPPAREPRPAEDEPTLHGKRVILSTPDGFVYDMRAVSHVYPDAAGRSQVDVVSEQDYYAWMLTDHVPKPVAYPARLVWVE